MSYLDSPANGKGFQEVKFNDKMAKVSEALYVAEEKAREAVAMRSTLQKELMIKEKEKEAMELRELARKARSNQRTITRDRDRML